MPLGFRRGRLIEQIGCTFADNLHLFMAQTVPMCLVLKRQSKLTAATTATTGSICPVGTMSSKLDERMAIAEDLNDSVGQ